jgi:para-nitrobenzyl esterase
VLVGTNLDEWRFFTGLDPRTAELDEPGLSALVRLLIANGGEASDPQVAEHVIATVRDARNKRREPVKPPDLWFALGTDFVFRHPAMRLAELQARHAPAFAYVFEWPSPVQGGIIGAGHLVEVPFVFGTHRDPSIRTFAGEGAEADRLAERLQDAWIAFARTGNPGHDGLPEWSPYDAKRRATMRLGATCQAEDAPREPERAVWDDLL